MIDKSTRCEQYAKLLTMLCYCPSTLTYVGTIACLLLQYYQWHMKPNCKWANRQPFDASRGLRMNAPTIMCWLVESNKAFYGHWWFYQDLHLYKSYIWDNKADDWELQQILQHYHPSTCLIYWYYCVSGTTGYRRHIIKPKCQQIDDFLTVRKWYPWHVNSTGYIIHVHGKELILSVTNERMSHLRRQPMASLSH